MSLRVLMTADPVGGVWTFAMELAGALSRGGFEIELAVMGGDLTTAQRGQAEAVDRLHLHEGSYELEWMESSWLSIEAAGEWLLDLERRLDPDLVHLNGYCHAALPWRAPVVVTGHSCVLSWWLAVHGEPAPPTWGRYAHEVRRGLRCAGVVVAPTSAMLDSLVLHYGVSGVGLVVPNGRLASRFTRAPKRRRILAVGRVWDEAKNLAAVDRVAARVPWPVLIAGEPRRPNGGTAFLHHARGLGLLGPAELHRAYTSAAIFALPALYEPFGYSPLEAALSGCALVLGDIPSLREVWGDAACFVPPREPEALREALIRLCEEPALRRDLAHRALERARAYTPERMAQGYAEAYRAALVEPAELLRARA